MLFLFCVNSHAIELNVLTTIRPLYGIVKSVAGDQAQVNILIDRNQSPHSYSLRPSDIIKIKSSNVIFMIDDSFEFGLAAYIKKSKTKINAIKFSHSNGVNLIDQDMHFWLSPYNAKVMANQVAKSLSELDPANSDTYYNNASNFGKELDSVDLDVKTILANSKSSFITFHDAYQYFSSYYHLNNMGAVLVNHNVNPGVKTMNLLADSIRKNNVKCIFAEPQHSDEIVYKLANMTHINVGMIDCEYGEGLELDKNIYFNMLKKIASEMHHCFAKSNAK